MNKDEVLEYLGKLGLDKNSFIVFKEASLVLLGKISTCSDITLITKEKIDCDLVFTLDIDFPYDVEIVSGYRVAKPSDTFSVLSELDSKSDKKLLKNLDLILCLEDNLRYEKKLYDKGITLIAGVDEVGRGPLIGPVVAAAVILPVNYHLEGLTDSKKLSEAKREYFYDIILKDAVSVGVGIISNDVIDEVNIYEATKLAMYDAINNLKVKPEHILIDAMPLDFLNSTSIIKGDIKSITISAASVVAKVVRDRMMNELDKEYPMYNFKKNKGYPTKEHIEAISKYGILPLHRKSYGPVRDYLNKKNN